jgi:hypothetical protein
VKKAVIFLCLVFSVAALAFSEYEVGALRFELPDNWEVEEEGMSLFAFSPDENFYLTGMIFYGLPDIATAKMGIMPLVRDMFRGLNITEEKMGMVNDTYPCLMITGTGLYENLDSQLYMLIVNGGDHFPILQIFGSNDGWELNRATAGDIVDSIQLTF